MIRIVLPLVLLPSFVFAECPAPPDIGNAETAIFKEIKTAKTEREARELGSGLWALWTKAPDAMAQGMLDQGMRARASWDLETALASFDALIDYCPDYAEGYNQRAFVNFIRQDYETVLVDLELAIARSPRHVGAIAGKALTLRALGREDEAQLVLREALRLNPWIPERNLLTIPMDEEL